jgi:hypothetical protein
LPVFCRAGHGKTPFRAVVPASKGTVMPVPKRDGGKFDSCDSHLSGYSVFNVRRFFFPRRPGCGLLPPSRATGIMIPPELRIVNTFFNFFVANFWERAFWNSRLVPNHKLGKNRKGIRRAARMMRFPGRIKDTITGYSACQASFLIFFDFSAG